MPMNIYFDARWTRTDYHDGISRYGAGVIGGFKEAGIPITILVKNKAQLKMLPDVPYLLVNDPLSPKELFLPRKLNKLGADVVYSPFQIMGTLGRKYKLILTLHDTIYYLHPQAPTNLSLLPRIVWRIFHMAHWPQRAVLNGADHISTVSNYSKKNIQDLHLTDREICVVYNAPSLKESDAHRSEKTTKNILYMGSFMPYKNVEVLIRGMAYLPDGFTLHLLSKIDKSRQAELEKLIKAGVKVVFHNGVTDAEYLELMQSAYCLASGSKEEGFGLPIIEAQMIGTPVVCSDMTIFHEVADDGALFFNNDDPEEFAKQVLKLDDKQFHQNLVKKGHESAKRFSWQKSAEKLYSVFQELVKS